MERIFWGMVFVLLDINIPLGQRTVGLLPDWLGYWWLAKGFAAGEEAWEGFRKAEIPALCMAALSLVRYGMQLMALTARQAFVLWLLGLVCAVAAVAAARYVLKGIRAMEQSRNGKPGIGRLGNLWPCLAVFLILKALLDWMPLVGMGCGVAAFAMAVCWLAALWNVQKHGNTMEE